MEHEDKGMVNATTHFLLFSMGLTNKSFGWQLVVLHAILHVW